MKKCREHTRGPFPIRLYSPKRQGSHLVCTFHKNIKMPHRQEPIILGSYKPSCLIAISSLCLFLLHTETFYGEWERNSSIPLSLSLTFNFLFPNSLLHDRHSAETVKPHAEKAQPRREEARGRGEGRGRGR